MPSDPSWWAQHSDLVLGIAATIIFGLIFGYLFLKLAEKPARLQYAVIDNAPLISNATSQPGLEILFKKKPVNNPYRVLIEVINTGKTDFISTDFVSPIKVMMPKCDVLSATGYNSSTGEVIPDLPLANPVQFTPKVLNAGETVLFALLVDGKARPEVHTEARGIKGIDEMTSPDKLRLRDVLSNRGDYSRRLRIIAWLFPSWILVGAFLLGVLAAHG